MISSLTSNMRTSLKMPAQHRNLSRRPAKPALGNGRVQRQCRRAFGPISTSVAICWSTGTAATTAAVKTAL
jgi:hypothetical protein